MVRGGQDARLNTHPNVCLFYHSCTFHSPQIKVLLTTVKISPVLGQRGKFCFVFLFWPFRQFSNYCQFSPFPGDQRWLPPQRWSGRVLRGTRDFFPPLVKPRRKYRLRQSGIKNQHLWLQEGSDTLWKLVATFHFSESRCCRQFLYDKQVRTLEI